MRPLLVPAANAHTGPKACRFEGNALIKTDRAPAFAENASTLLAVQRLSR